MTPNHRAFLLAAVLSGAAFLGESAFAAQNTQSTATAPSTAEGDTTPVQPFQRVEPNVPPTPMPMSLPDPARAAEIRNEYGFGVATLIAGAVLFALAIYLAVYFAVRRSWSAIR
jgi:hypothetical protein